MAGPFGDVTVNGRIARFGCASGCAIIYRLRPATNESSRLAGWKTAEAFGGTRGTNRARGWSPDFWARRAQFRGIWAGSRAELTDSVGNSGRAVHDPDQRRHQCAADHRLLFLPSDNRGLSDRRRLLHRREIQSWFL